MSTVRVIQNKQRLTKEGNAPLYITFYLGKEKLMLPCKVSVPAAKFDEKSGLLKGNSKEAKDINLIVSNLKARVNDILVKFRLRNQALTKDIFMREYNNPSDYKTFHDFVKEHMKTYSRRIEMGTFKHHLSCMKKFKAYNELLQFQDLTPDYLTDYLIYMKKELGNTEITAQRNMSTIKIYVTAAYRKGYIEENPFQEFHIKRIKSDVDYLTEEELMQFVQLYYQRTLPEKLQLTLAFFLFMCFTSMHITDARMFCIEQVNNDVLTYYRVKNRNCKPEPIKIPMPVPAEKLLEEWAEGREEGRLFRNVQCDQVVNRQLKAIAKELGINKKISAKTGRHTFATIYLRKTKDLSTVLNRSKNPEACRVTARIADGRLETDEQTIMQADLITHFELFVRREMEAGRDPYVFAERLMQENPDAFVTADEIGCGIVPMEAFERDYRETDGRICQRIAAYSEEVHRVICGLGMRIK